MGITKLAELIRSEAPTAISYRDISDYTGRTVALDTSVVLHQFRSAIPVAQNLRPLTGLFFRTLHFLEHDIKPVYVFDGTPPDLKRNELEKRAKAVGYRNSYNPGIVSPQIRDCQRLLQLLGVPYLQAPGDGEAFCAQLAKQGKVDAVASEDMDTMPFGSELLIRQMDAKKSEVLEYSLSKLLEALKLTHKEFVDLCILLGCDYCDKIHGLGPKRALKLIQEHKTIEQVALHVNRTTHPVPICWKYQEARQLFLEEQQELTRERQDLTWTNPQEEELVQFLCHEKHIKETRVRSRMDRFRKTLEQRRQQREERLREGQNRQTGIKDFFRVTRRRPAAEASGSTCQKKARIE